MDTRTRTVSPGATLAMVTAYTRPLNSTKGACCCVPFCRTVA